MSAAAKILLGLTPVFGPSMIGAASLLEGAGAYRESRNQAGIYAAYEHDARQKAQDQARQEREKYRKLASSRRAAMGASGVDVNSGSVLDVWDDTRAEGEESAMRLLHGGEIEASRWRRRAASAKRGGVDAFAQGVGSAAATAGKSPLYRSLWGLE